MVHAACNSLSQKSNRSVDIAGIPIPTCCHLGLQLHRPVAYAEYALASADMMARKPHLSRVEAASAPVVAVTAWQMLFDYAKVVTGQTVLILGAAGIVGAYAVQFAAAAGLDVIALVGRNDIDYVRSLGARTVLDYKNQELEDDISPVDAVIDTVGGEARERSFRLLKAGGILVSVVSAGTRF